MCDLYFGIDFSRPNHELPEAHYYYVPPIYKWGIFTKFNFVWRKAKCRWESVDNCAARII